MFSYSRPVWILVNLYFGIGWMGDLSKMINSLKKFAYLFVEDKYEHDYKRQNT